MVMFRGTGVKALTILVAMMAVFITAGFVVPQIEAAILYENFEDGTLDSRISITTEGSFNSPPGIKDVTNFGSSKAFGFGTSQCGANCFHFFMTTMKIEFPSPTFVSTLSFKEMELYGNWGSGGKIFINGQALTGGDSWDAAYHNFGRLPYNDGQADSTYRIKTFQINQYVTMIELKVWDITNSSEIFIDDLLISGDCTPLPSGMVSWWGGDNNALDLIGTNHGTLMNGTTYAQGMVGQAFSFDGVDDYVEMVGNIGDFGSNPFTIDFWMYSYNSGNSAYIMGKSHPDGGQGWDIRLNNGKIRLEGTDGWDPSYNWESNGTLTPNTWHHIAISATTDSINVYINGILDGTTTRSTISSTSNPFRIGFTTNYGGTPFNGLIDEIEIFNRALTADEIAAIYIAGSAGKCRPCTPSPSGIISWWKAENNADDSVGTNHGTLMNGATYATGKVGQAFSFDGVDDYIEIPKVSAWDFNVNSFSITAWFKTNISGYRNIVRYDNGFGDQGLWGVRVEPFGKIQFLIKGDLQYDITTNNAYADDTWHLIAAVRDATEGKLKIYIDGYPAATEVSDGGANLIGSSSHRLAIGAGLWGSGGTFENFAGLIDEVTIYNRALTADEIASIYNAGSSGKCSIQRHTLTVIRAGTGSGTVSSSPEGINCGEDCSEEYIAGTRVTLNAVADPGSKFAGWSGDCTGDGQVTITSNKTCTAFFNLYPTIVDFDEDRKSDILWWHPASGTVAIWFMDDEMIDSVEVLGAVPEGWQIQGTGDFNGDRKTDILWQHADTGTVALWFIDENEIDSVSVIGAVPSDWQVKALGDFNGDGKFDVLWQHTDSGTVAIWMMDGGTIGSIGVPGAVSSDWVIKGVGDFNNDGKTDVLWQHSDSGTVAIWMMNGGSVASISLPGAVLNDWMIKGVGDFNNDGTSDILWMHPPSGTVALWMMDSGLVASIDVPGVVSEGWEIKGTGDFNGDSKSDVLWMHPASGAVAIWLMDGSTISFVGVIGAVPAGWEIKN